MSKIKLVCQRACHIHGRFCPVMEIYLARCVPDNLMYVVECKCIRVDLLWTEKSNIHFYIAIIKNSLSPLREF